MKPMTSNLQTDLFGKTIEKKQAQPPKGYIKFIMRGQTSNDIVCPNCGTKGAGSMYGPGGWQDPTAQAFADKHFARDHQNGYDALCQIIDGVMLKEHWSRYYAGEFLCCGAQIWNNNDFSVHYYLPKRLTYEEKQRIQKEVAEEKNIAEHRYDTEEMEEELQE